MTTKKRWPWTHNGFHGRTPLRIMVRADAQAGDEVPVSEATARRLAHECCGSADCTCGETPATQTGADEYAVILPVWDGEQRGNYPQGI